MQEHNFTLKDLFKREWLPSLISALTLLVIAYIVEHYTNIYAFEYSLRPTSNHVGDLILDNIPVIDLNFIIIEGALLSIVLGTLFVLSKPRYVLFTLKSLALFIIIRALFVSLTHVGIYPEHITPGLGFFDGIYLYLNFQQAYFFPVIPACHFLWRLSFGKNFPFASYFYHSHSSLPLPYWWRIPIIQ